MKAVLGILAAACVWLSGCGGGSGANVVTVTLTDSLGGTVVVTQADTITATVAGPATVAGVSNLNVTFKPCQYSTTPPAGSTMKAVSLATCPTDGSFGTFSNVQPTTEIYTAPAKIPDPTMFPNLVLTIAAVSVADPSKKGTLTLTLDSGIVVTINPSAATLAVGQGGNPGESRIFTASVSSDTTQGGVMWGVTNTTVNTGGSPSIANTFTLTTPQCSPSCGAIAMAPGGNVDNETFTAPSTLPTNTTAILYAIAIDDPSRFATTTISLVTGGNIVFHNLWPTVVPQGGSQADVFLNATNLTSQIGLTLTNNTTGVSTPIDAGSDALKVFFTPSTFGATTGPVSTGARLRLTPDQLAKPATYTVAITPGNPADQTTPISTFSFKVVPVRPGLVASNPSDFAQGSGSTNAPVSISVDGGYYGAQDNIAVTLNFNGGALVTPAQPAGSDTRRLIGQVTNPVSVPGLLPINVTNSLDPSNISTVYSNIAVLPSYANPSVPSSLPFDTKGTSFLPCVVANQPPPPPGTQPTCTADVNGNLPTLVCTTPGSTTCPIPAPISLGANTMPSAIAVDPILGYAAITEAGTNTVQFLNLSTTPLSLSAAFPTGVPAAGNLPTGVAIDRHVCAKGTAADPTTGQCPVAGPFQAIAAVVNYEAQTLAVLTIPNGTLIETIPLNNLIPPSGLTGAGANPSPFPYSVGIDTFTHRALVAFANTNAGFVINLDPSQSPNICLAGFAPGDGTSYCPVALATLNTGSNPQIAFEPGAHLAYATPGGAGQLTAVNLSDPSAAPVKIQSATRAADIVTVTLAANTSLNFSPDTTPTVLISGLPLGTAGSSFNGAFPVLSVTSNTTFTYAQTGPTDTATSTAAQQGFLSVGTSDITYAISPTIQGIDINPITHSAVLADPNNAGASNGGSQVTFIDSLDQNITSLSLCNETNLAIVTPTPCTPELGISAVAYQPFTNTVVSLRFDNQNLFNNQISLLNPAAFNRVTIVETGQMEATSICFPTTACNSTPQGTGAVTVSLNGAIAVDPIHNLALAVNSGSGSITPLFLGNIKPLQIETVSTPPVDASSSIPNPANLAQSVIINSTALPQSISGTQIFGRGFNSSSVVRLDGVPLPASDVTFSSSRPNELDVTIPATNGTQNILTGPRNFGLDVANSDGTTSNVMDFHVIEAIPLPACTAGAAAPGGVAIADDLVFTAKNYAVVTETGCAQVAVINLNAGSQFATFSTIATGKGPTGVATIPRFGYAVVSNNTDGTASILDLTTGMHAAGATTDVVVGTSPAGVAIEQETGLAIIANTGSNTATVIDMTPLQANPVGTLAPLTVATDQEPIAVAIDPDRGANATGEAVVTSLSISSTPASGALDVVDLSTTVPAKNATATTSVGSIPTGIIFDPASFPARLFYATESDSNAFITYDPDTGATTTVQVGINPFAVAYNFQTSSILTVNSTSNTSSIIDSLSFQTQNTLGIGGASLFSAAIEPLSNLAVIADQANNRVLLFPMPH